jgi:hypothetical protein
MLALSPTFRDACAKAESPSVSDAMVDVFHVELDEYVRHLRAAGVPPHRFLTELRPILDVLGTRSLQARALTWAIASYYSGVALALEHA